MAHRRSLLLVLLVVALGALAPAAAQAKRAPRLIAFDSCASLVGYAHRYATVSGGGVGVPMRALGGVPQVVAPPPVAVNNDTKSPSAVEAPAAPAPSADGGTETQNFSGTNVQEVGIDEPDVVKTDGKHVFTIVNGSLQVLDVTGDQPRIVGTLALDGGFSHQLLLRGNRLLVMSTRYGPIDVEPVAVAAPRLVPIVAGRSETLLTEVDVSDPAAPKVARTMTLDGSFIDARQTGGTIRVVVSTTPDAPGPVPLQRATLRTFVPVTTIRSRISGRTFRRGVVPCDDVRRPDVFSGLELLTVLTIDLDRGLYSVDRDAIMAGAQTVYASDKSLYVASQRYVRAMNDVGDVPDGMRTEIHRFDASAPGATTYAASGTVPGFVVNQFALSELNGDLRVASTTQPAWLPDGSGQVEQPQSVVSVLRQDGSRLGTIGSVGGLGAGQRIYAVRFLGPVGYVVTFRQIDPLYTIDLSDPAKPTVAGQLELPGYSAYLHPVGDGRLLGVGQEANGQGRPLGTQVSLFDVSDIKNPKRLAHVVFGNGNSDAEFDHHAFLFWQPTGLAVLPLQTFDPDQGSPFVGAVGVKVGASTLSELGRVVHGSGDQAAAISRSLVIGDRLFTLSYRGLLASRLDTLAPVGFAEFPQPPQPSPSPEPGPAAGGGGNASSGSGTATPGTTTTAP